MKLSGEKERERVWMDALLGDLKNREKINHGKVTNSFELPEY